jgi:hypothetical protein
MFLASVASFFHLRSPTVLANGKSLDSEAMTRLVTAAKGFGDGTPPSSHHQLVHVSTALAGAGRPSLC